MSKKKADIVTSDHGFAVSFFGKTKRGQRWLCDNCDWEIEGLAEHRYAPDIILGAVADGRILRGLEQPSAEELGL